MTEPVPQPRKELSGCILVGVAVSLLVLLGIAVFCLTAKLSADRADRVLEDLRNEAKSHPSVRPVLVGDSAPGNAWDDYNLILKDEKAMSACLVVEDRANPESPWDTQERKFIEEVLAANPQVIEHLQRGARKAEAQYPHDWEKNTLEFRGNLWIRNVRIARLAACRARIFRSQGRLKEAAELLLDIAQFGRDTGHNGYTDTEEAGYSAIMAALPGLRIMILMEDISHEDLAYMARALEVLDGSLPSHARCLTNDELLFGNTLRDWHPRATINPTTPLEYYYYGQCVKHLHQSFLRATAATPSYHDAQQIERQLWADLGENPIMNVFARNFEMPRPGTSGRECRARIRLLRAAAHLKATGDILELDDPFGDKIKHSLSGNTLKLWSLGPDATDGGGADPGDLVLTVERTP